MALDWNVKELMTARKMNNLSVRKYTNSEYSSLLEDDKLPGDIFFNPNAGHFVYFIGKNIATQTDAFNILGNTVYCNSDSIGLNDLGEIDRFDYHKTNGLFANKLRIYFMIGDIRDDAKVIARQLGYDNAPITGAPGSVSKDVENEYTSVFLDLDLNLITDETSRVHLFIQNCDVSNIIAVAF